MLCTLQIYRQVKYTDRKLIKGNQANAFSLFMLNRQKQPQTDNPKGSEKFVVAVWRIIPNQFIISNYVAQKDESTKKKKNMEKL